MSEPSASASPTPAQTRELGRETVRRVVWRLVPFLSILFIVNFLDRTNVGFAALQMNGDIGIGASIYGLGAGIFFLGYMAFEIPSNILLHKFGARIWIARIMITWGLVATAMGFLKTPTQFVALRFLLGLAEAGFFPGIIFLLSLWIPREYRARTIATFYLGLPIAQVIGAPMSTSLMALGGHVGLPGWRLMYVTEGFPAIALGIASLFYLTDSPALAKWLRPEQRDWLVETLAKEDRAKTFAADGRLTKGEQIRRVLSNKFVWILALIYFGITSGSNTMNFFLPSVLQSFRGTFGVNISLAMNGVITAIPYTAAAIGMYYWSAHSDRRQERRKHTGGASLLAAVSIAVALLLNHPVVIVIGFVLLGAGIYSAINVFWAIPPQMLSGVEAATGIALINSIGNLSGFAGPYITGFLVSITGTYRASFFVIAAFVALAGIGIWMLPERDIGGDGVGTAAAGEMKGATH
jgi:MFS transporter, ACS family, tartrate transporter